jgi:hypothetical protein
MGNDDSDSGTRIKCDGENRSEIDDSRGRRDEERVRSVQVQVIVSDVDER